MLVRSKAFLLGAAWTFAWGVPIFFFKSSGPWPICVMSLGAVGVGWAVLLRRERAALAATCNDSRDAVDGIAQVLIKQMQGTCTELERVDELLGHAIDELMVVFSSVSVKAREHQNDLARMAVANQGTLVAEQLCMTAACINDDLDRAVTALQFRDVVGQKLGHVHLELVTLEQAMHGIREVSSQCVQANLAVRVGGVLREMQQARPASPVRQKQMHAGEIELF